MSKINLIQLKGFFQPHVETLFPLIVEQCEGSATKMHDVLEEALYLHAYMPVRLAWQAFVKESVTDSSAMIDQFVLEYLV